MVQSFNLAGMLAVLNVGDGALNYLFGFSSEPPEAQLGIDWTRLRGYCQRWQARRGVSFKAKSGPAADGNQSEQISRLAAQLAASDQRIAALQTEVAELKATPTEEQFAERFGRHGASLFGMGLSFDQAERVFLLSMRSGLSFALARASLGQQPTANSTK